MVPWLRDIVVHVVPVPLEAVRIRKQDLPAPKRESNATYRKPKIETLNIFDIFAFDEFVEDEVGDGVDGREDHVELDPEQLVRTLIIRLLIQI